MASLNPAWEVCSHDLPGVVHELKTWPGYFERVYCGFKTLEIRLNDRGFEEGDTLHLREFDPTLERYTGREIAARVTDILYSIHDAQKNPRMGIRAHQGVSEGYVAMSIYVYGMREP